MTSTEPSERVGQVLLGKLRVVRQLGGGGMGEVYEVEHLLTHHRRALKIVRGDLAKQPRYVERLLREASIAGRLATPFVVETLDAGRLDDGSAYVLMELLQGRTLHEVLQLDPKLPQQRVANILAQVCEGMAVAHTAGVVHRDLKPENVFLLESADGEERVKILDFGISKIESLVAAPATRLTREGTLIGTPFYMSPEQAAGREVDARADIWAIGVIAYEALTGRVPFDGSTVGEVMMLIASSNYAPLLYRRPDVDPKLAAVVDRALRPDPRDRYPDAEEMRRDLVRFASHEHAARARTLPETAPAGSPSTLPPPPPSPTPSSSVRKSDPSRPAVDPRTPATTPVSQRPPRERISGERASRGLPFGGIVLVAIALGVTVTFLVAESTGGASGIDGAGTAEAPAPPAAPPETTAPEHVDDAPVAEAIVDAGRPEIAPPPTTTTTTATAPPTTGRRPPPHTRTLAERAGLEGNPYETP
ncbi:MAG: serine/threonine-protein kinase [Sandaracinus sp.]